MARQRLSVNPSNYEIADAVFVLLPVALDLARANFKQPYLEHLAIAHVVRCCGLNTSAGQVIAPAHNVGDLVDPPAAFLRNVFKPRAL